MDVNTLPNFEKIFEDDDPTFYHLDRLSAAYVVIAYLIADSYKRDEDKVFKAAEDLQNFAPVFIKDSNIFKILTLLNWSQHVAKICNVDSYVLKMIQTTKDYYERDMPPAEG